MAKKWKKKISIRRRFVDIVLIAILIRLLYSLLPYPHHHSTKNKDVIRRNNLFEIETVINNYKDSYWVWPDLDNAKNGITVSSIAKTLKQLWLDKKAISDPNEESKVYWLWEAIATWEYLYLVTKKDWIDDWWFILMSKADLEWWTNWIVCKDGSWLDDWYITNDTDINDIELCYWVNMSDTCSAKDCIYTTQEELRHIVASENIEKYKNKPEY